MFHRYFSGRVTQFAIDMEEQALNLVEVIKGEREAFPGGSA
jgi:biopolymer transport protein ExbB